MMDFKPSDQGTTGSNFDKLVPPKPPCMDCRRERVYQHCYRDCYKWLDYADDYKKFVRRRDALKREERAGVMIND